MTENIANLSRQASEPDDDRSEAALECVSTSSVYMLDRTGRVTSWNVEAELASGFTGEDLLGRDLSVFFAEADREQGLPAEALNVARSAGRYEMQGWRLRHEGSLYWAHAAIDALRDSSGEVIGFIMVTRDVSELRNAQLALTRARHKLARAQKMQAIGELTSAIAHDFKNLLMVVGGQIELTRQRLSEVVGAKPLDAIERALNVGEVLTRQLLTFSRQRSAAPVPIDVEKRIGAFREILRSALRGNIRLVYDIAADIWPILADSEQFELALLNVALHARDMMPGGGEFTLQARNCPAGKNAALEFVEFTLSSTATGAVARTLEPSFERVKADGSSIGLAQVRRFAVESGGTAVVEAKPAGGTIVILRLPRGPGAKPRTDTSREDGANSSTVLLVEDNADVAEITQVMLTSLGYAVRWVSDAVQAMSLLDTRHEFDVVLTDIVMPGGMDGIDFAHAVRARYANLPCVLMTGYSDSAQAAGSDFPVLRKPFKLSALQEALVEMRA